MVPQVQKTYGGCVAKSAKAGAKNSNERGWLFTTKEHQHRGWFQSFLSITGNRLNIQRQSILCRYGGKGVAAIDACGADFGTMNARPVSRSSRQRGERSVAKNVRL